MKISELSQSTFDQLVDLECENIIPILKSVGINLNRTHMIQELESFKEDHVVLLEESGSVQGFIVFSINTDHILIKTFNLKVINSRKVLLGLLLKIVKELKGNDVNKIVSHCHLTNQRSLNLHRGLGFYENSKNDKFIEFIANRDSLLERIADKTSKIR